MKLIPVFAGDFHCDGGALFGVIPKVLWSKVYPVDDNNFTSLTLRCLLVDQGERKILIETGIGNHYPEKYLRNNGVSSVGHLSLSLKQLGYSPEDITDVLFTHLHWDHCTGAVRTVNGKLEMVFPNASLWCSKRQFEHSKHSNPREQAAFNKEIIDFMMSSGKLELIEKEGELFDGLNVRFFDGHTPGQIIPLIKKGDETVAYLSDLIPTAANIPVLWVAAYDLDPVAVMREKETFLTEAAEQGYILFFEHDKYTECARVEKSEKGVVLGETGTLNQWIG